LSIRYIFLTISGNRDFLTTHFGDCSAHSGGSETRRRHGLGRECQHQYLSRLFERNAELWWIT